MSEITRELEHYLDEAMFSSLHTPDKLASLRTSYETLCREENISVTAMIQAEQRGTLAFITLMDWYTIAGGSLAMATADYMIERDSATVILGGWDKQGGILTLAFTVDEEPTNPGMIVSFFEHAAAEEIAWGFSTTAEFQFGDVALSVRYGGKERKR